MEEYIKLTLTILQLQWSCVSDVDWTYHGNYKDTALGDTVEILFI